MESLNDWDLQAVVRSCSFSASPEAPRSSASFRPAPREEDQELVAGRVPEVRGSARAASLFHDLEYLDLDHELARLFLLEPTDELRLLEHEVLISFPAASTSGVLQPRHSGRRPGIRTPRPKRSKKSQLKKVVCEVPVADGGISSDLWAWRKYGQKPIKGSPYPRGYYKCSSLKGCMAKKMVERSPAKPGVLIVTYMAEHCHPVPTQLNTLAGTTRHKSTPPDPSPSSPDKAGRSVVDEVAKLEDSTETSTMAVDGGAETADDENDFWPTDLEQLLGSMDDDHDFFEHDSVLGRRLSL